MTAVKLKVDVKSGVLEVEGSEDFVRRAFEEFREFYSAKSSSPGGDAVLEENVEEGPAKKRAKRQPRSMEERVAKASNYKPELDKELDVSGLREFFANYEPKNNPEKVLIFCKFLEDKNQTPCSLNQVFTCYVKMAERVPKAFVQTMRDTASAPYGYVDFDPKSLTLRITTAGFNHITHDLKKKS